MIVVVDLPSVVGNMLVLLLGISGSPTLLLRVCDPRGWYIRIYFHADSEIRMDGKHPHGRETSAWTGNIRMDGKHPHGRNIRMDEHEQKQQDITR